MLRTRCNLTLRTISSRQPVQAAAFSSSYSHSIPYQPNAPLDLDPAFQSLLKDVEMAMTQKARAHHPVMEKPPRQVRELEEFPADAPSNMKSSAWELEETETRDSRKSPAALFGSRKIGAVILPKELQSSVGRLIEDSDKSMLHVDAKRLFSDGDGKDGGWDSTYDVRYKSGKQAFRHSERDGTAFASVALPAHYSAIYSVLSHVKQRLGDDWKIERVIDWGAGTGSGLWASAYASQQPNNSDASMEELILDTTTIQSYLGIDKREGLVNIAKRLLQNVRHVGMSVSWQKSLPQVDRIKKSSANNTVAMSAFLLSSIPAPLSRKAVVKDMWDSGAQTIVLIDHNSPQGFEYIAEARQYLLDLGAKEQDDPAAADWSIRGSHVVAPCPHDGACPLYHPDPKNRLVCGFEQRLQRPAFVRKTKHSGVGHEDVGYSYVVIRRGPRPNTTSNAEIGRIGQVGKEDLEKAREKVSQRELVETAETFDHPHEEIAPPASIEAEIEPEIDSGAELESALRSESFNWPRLVFPPLKRSGHIILDCCTPQGKIMRMTIPKSQGKQEYYDARKSQWGDLFPHDSKIKPVERYLPMTGNAPSTGTDIGKRKLRPDAKQRAFSYEQVAADVKERKKYQRRERTRRGRDIFEQLD